MKKIIIPILLSAAAVFSACNPDLLEIPQKGVVSTDTFYKTDADAEASMVAVYQGFVWNYCAQGGASIYSPIRACFNLCGDDMYAAGEYFGDNDFMAAMNEFRYDNGSEVIRNAYNNIYYTMYYTNLVIHYFKDGLPEGGHTAVTKRVVAEARVLRAYLHMMLAIGWGTPPLVDDLLDASDNPANYPGTQQELFLWCAAECEAAIADLDERKSPTDKAGAVKVTKGFANAVAGKCYLFAKDYAKAKTALKAVIDSKKYELVPGERYWENFHIEGDANEEKIFEGNIELNANVGWGDLMNRTTWMESQIWNWRSDHFVANPSSSYSSIDGWGGLGVPQWIADEFIANDGEDSYRTKATIIPAVDVIYNTVYGLEAVDKLTLEQKKTSTALGIDARGLYGQSFYLPLKQIAKTTDLMAPGQNLRVNNFVIMRYAEVLLMYAEACLQTGDAASAKTYINMIQERAGSKTVSASVDMDVLKREKKLELWLEGNRWADMVRWGDFDSAKNAGTKVTVLYDKLTREPKAEDKNVTWHKDGRFYTVEVKPAVDDFGYEVGFKAGKHELFPFPYTVMSKNPNLVQNPGW